MNKKVKVGFLILLGVVITVTGILLLVRSKNTGKGNVKYAWQSAPDPGSVCSVSCGGGTRYLTVWCEAVDSTGKDIQVVDNSLCDQSSKPANSETCNTQACDWITGVWGSCSLPCGGGTQSRTVTCVAGDESKCLMSSAAIQAESRARSLVSFLNVGGLTAERPFDRGPKQLASFWLVGY